MNKPNQLKAHLLASVRALRDNPEQLSVFIDNGNLATRLRAGLSFEYQYQLNLVFTDWSQHPNVVLVPLLAWLKVHQSELDEKAVQFEAEILDKDKIDLSITVPLTERVIVTTDSGGNYHTEHAAEPELEENEIDPVLFQNLLDSAGQSFTPGQPDDG
ncbi:phage tail protein [Motiliproteus sp.]|uniref:phage tail protein n=1 Tax=Motiliproteus sp. TaxID=1898955 RepID=UPI003BA91B39